MTLLWFLLGIYPEVELLIHMIIFLPFWGTDVLLSISAALFYILITVKKAYNFSVFMSTLVFFWFFYYMLLGICLPYVASVSIFLMFSDVKHLFMCWWFIHISSLQKSLFKLLSHFFNIPLFFHCWVSGFLYISGILILCEICDIFPCVG